MLGRKQKVHNPDVLKEIKNKIILVTGAGGSIGGELCRQLSLLNAKLIILLESDEYALYKISSELNGKFVAKLADIKDYAKMEEIIKQFKPDIIFHCRST